MPESVNQQARYARAEALLKTLAEQQGWKYRPRRPEEQGPMRSIVQVTANLGLELVPRRGLKAGPIIKVGGSVRARKWQHSWRLLSGTNDKVDARIILELAHTLVAKEEQIQAQLAQEKAIENRIDNERLIISRLAEEFTAKTGRTVAAPLFGITIASNQNYSVSPELQQKETDASLVKVIRIDAVSTEMVIHVPNELAADLYKLIDGYRKPEEKSQK